MDYKGYFTKSVSYADNTRITVYDSNSTELYYVILNNYEVYGYCSCLIDMGYENRGWV